MAYETEPTGAAQRGCRQPLDGRIMIRKTIFITRNP
jgi:hypothetical protein